MNSYNPVQLPESSFRLRVCVVCIDLDKVLRPKPQNTLYNMVILLNIFLFQICLHF